jgi:hypothetical protein
MNLPAMTVCNQYSRTSVMKKVGHLFEGRVSEY